jgi:hypothetical protein
MSEVNVVLQWTGTVLSDDINKYFLYFCVIFIASVGEINCHTVCKASKTEELSCCFMGIAEFWLYCKH